MIEDRKILLQLTSDLVLLLQGRAEVVSLIQSKKRIDSEKTHFPNFDKDRELTVFNTLLLELKDFSLQELLAISLIIEGQVLRATKENSYPKWSERVHLLQNSGELFEQINPILLSLVRPSEYQKLRLKPEFQV